MLLMGGGTLLYENERNDTISTILIFLLLLGIYGLISINETNKIHYIFTSLVFITIICFMIRHLTIVGTNEFTGENLESHTQAILSFSVIPFRKIWSLPPLFVPLILSFLLELMGLIYIIINIHGNIFFAEIFYILNFAFFYLYLHFLSFHSPE